jgi:membrane protein required for colicin V production
VNIIDFIIAIPVLWGIIKGFSRGLIVEIAQLAALVLGCLLGSKFSYLLSDFLMNTFDISGPILPVVSFLAIFVAVIIGVMFMAKALSKLTKAVALGWLNRTGGMVFGGMKWLIVAGIILQVIITNDSNYRIISESKREQSLLLSTTLKMTNFFSPYLKKALFDHVDEIKSKEGNGFRAN